MPTYVYKFIDSGETIEVQQAFTDDALTEAVHPASGETLPVKKVFLPVGVTFKGGGFYKTDSRGGSGSSSSSTATETGSSGATSGGTSSDGSSGSSTSGTDSKPSADSGSKTPSTATPAPSTASSSSNSD